MGDEEDNTGDPHIPRHARAQTERSSKERGKGPHSRYNNNQKIQNE